MEEQYAELRHKDGYITALMNREIDIPINEIWPLLSEESERVKWLAPGTIDLYVGGKVDLDFKDSYVLVESEVTACEAPRVLAFSWSGKDDPLRPIRFELAEIENGTRISLTVSIPDSEVVARSCAGWEAHLTMLQAVAAGASVKFPIDRFKACQKQFEQQVTQLMMTSMPFVRL